MSSCDEPFLRQYHLALLLLFRFVTELEKKIGIERNCFAQKGDSQNDGDKSDQYDVSKNFPKFILVLRDFAFEIEVDGKEVNFLFLNKYKIS